MFEKEAEKCFKERYPNNIAINSYYVEGFNDGYNKAFVEADKNLKAVVADFNKANEWHLVKDGDLPKDEEYKWCVSSRGYPYVARYEELFVSWTNRENKEVMCPYAWKEIVLPKEIKEK